MIVDDLWQCPKCERRFANENQAHSCGRFTVEDFLEGQNPEARGLFERFSMLVDDCGPYLYAPAKTRGGFQVRMIFAAVNGLSVLTDRLGRSCSS